ncbi:hypothetical protein AYR66_08585 [Noviherbaspirillum denitrificans]|uniref:Diguanylate cyclase n=2 Tax=Noviherbaspirillum denitrificans TaxID=1968433 RepID=A0A254TAA4_9BURK|nr:hypothetical protein AYR66_08585 [Noviherbaspirillum denitrificans]
MIGASLIAGLWTVADHRATALQSEAEIAANTKAVSLANTYALQLNHTITQIDQLTLRLKYDWEDRNAIVDLKRDQGRGLLPQSQLYASVVGPTGDLLTSTLKAPPNVNISDMEHFRAHQAGCCDEMLITKSERGRVLNRPVVRFSRRISGPGGGFGGIVVVSVEPTYFVTFQEHSTPGNQGFISARLASGPLVATKAGNKMSEIPIFYKNPPVFPKDVGVVVESGERFIDGEQRIVAWKKLNNYPMLAIAALSTKDVFATSNAAKRDFQHVAILGSLLVAMFSALAAFLSLRLAQRRRQAENAADTYRIATDAANEGFYTIRPLVTKQGYIEDFVLEDCNHRAAHLVGLTRNQLRGKRLSKLKPRFLREELQSLCGRALEKGFLDEEYRIPAKSPMKATWIHRRIVCSAAGLALTIRDISDAKAHEQALSDLANSDSLTKLPNRNWLGNFLPSAITRASLQSGNLSVLFIDLDNFKNINDTLGHDVGDELLVQASARLKGALRSTDHVVRLGGDEFVVILEHTDSSQDAERVSTSLIRTLAEPYSLSVGNSNRITASIGISIYPSDGDDCETLLKHADIAMYVAKAEAKGTYCCYRKEFSETLCARLDNEGALRQAVERDEFVVHYQPRVDTLSGRLSSMEALVRWRRPGWGLVYPGDFIELAESTGLIVRLGEIVIEKTVAQIAAWKREGKTVVPVSVNVSPKQLRDGTVSGFFEQTLIHFGVEACHVEVELTESAVVDRSPVVTEELSKLRALGLRLMVDDFGTGHSSLAQLHRKRSAIAYWQRDLRR